MTAREDWYRIPYPLRLQIVDALQSSKVAYAVAQIFDPPSSVNELHGAELAHDEEHALRTALAVLEEMWTGVGR